MGKKLTDSKWTDEELQILHEFGCLKTAKELSEILSHSVLGISSKLKRLKIKPSLKWSEKELSILKNNCNLKPKDLAKLLPNRSTKSILKARSRYDFGEKYKTQNDWTEGEIQTLRKYGSDIYSTQLSELIPNHTAGAIAAKCFKLGIKKTNECRAKLGRIGQASRLPIVRKLDQSLTLESLDEKTLQILLGSILGDGCCNKSAKRYIFSESHGWKQKDYVLWKQNELTTFSPNYAESSVPTIFTPSHDMFAFLRKKIYGTEKTKNLIPSEVIEKLDYLGLLIWYLDDGYLGRPKSGLKCNGKKRLTYPTICVKGYRFDELEKACATLNFNLGINTYLSTHKHNGGVNKIICLNNDKKKLFPIWFKMSREMFIPDCMHYKLNNLQEE